MNGILVVHLLRACREHHSCEIDEGTQLVLKDEIDDASEFSAFRKQGTSSSFSTYNFLPPQIEVKPCLHKHST